MISKSEILKSSKTLINSWLSLPNSFIVEIFGNLKLDFITLDMQHGFISLESIPSMLQASSIKKKSTLIRIPWNEPITIMKVLDAGANGVICPMINTKDEAEKFVKTCYYPPLGYRSYGPMRANLANDADYVNNANKEIMTFAQIETVEGLENIEDILEVQQLDGVYVGTIDLSISMGLEDHGNLDNPILAEAVEHIMDKINQAGKIGAIHTMNPDDIPKVTKWGYHIITPLNDVTILKNQTQFILNQTNNILND